MRVIAVKAPGGAEELIVSQASVPVPAAGEIRVKVAAAGVNRADVLQRQGYYPPPKGISDVIGLEISGIVDACGEGVSDWNVGAECVALLAGGGYAEYAVLPQGQAVPLPSGIDLVTAAGIIEVAATVVSNFDHVHLAAGETVLIHGGSGGIGTFGIQYAKALGAKVAITAGTSEKRELCKELGADIALDYHEDWVSALKDATAGHGADVICDIMGAKYLEPNIAALAKGGRLFVIGLQGGRRGSIDLNQLLAKRATLTATSLRFRPVSEKVAICQRLQSEVWPLLANGQIKPAPTSRFDFADVANAHRQLESGENVGKIVLTL